MAACRPECPRRLARISNFLPEGAWLSGCSVAPAPDVEQRFTKHLPLIGRKPERSEEDRLEPPDRVRRRDQIVPNLCILDDRPVGVRQKHEGAYPETVDPGKRCGINEVGGESEAAREPNDHVPRSGRRRHRSTVFSKEQTLYDGTQSLSAPTAQGVPMLVPSTFEFFGHGLPNSQFYDNLASISPARSTTDLP